MRGLLWTRSAKTTPPRTVERRPSEPSSDLPKADPDPRSAAAATPRSREPDGQRSPIEVVSGTGPAARIAPALTPAMVA